MKKVLTILVLMVAVLACAAQAADTNTVFDWQRPNQSGMLTISNLTLAGSAILPAGTTIGGAGYTTNISAAAYVTNATVAITATWTTQLCANVDGTTNTVITPSALTGTMTLQKATPTAQNVTP